MAYYVPVVEAGGRGRLATTTPINSLSQDVHRKDVCMSATQDLKTKPASRSSQTVRFWTLVDKFTLTLKHFIASGDPSP